MIHLEYDRNISWIRKIICYFLICLCFLDAFTMYGESQPLKSILNAMKIVNVLFLFIIIIQALKTDKVVNFFGALLLMPLCWMYFFEEGGGFGVGVMKTISRIIPSITFLLLNDNEKKFIVKITIKLILYFAIPSIIIYMLVYIVRIDLPSFVVNHPNDENRPITCYFGITFIYKELFRLAGLYDEPGQLGTIMLFIYAFYFNNLTKLGKWVVVLAGLFSWSFYFFTLVLPVYVFYLFINKRRKKIGIIISVTFIICFLIIANLQAIKNSNIAFLRYFDSSILTRLTFLDPENVNVGYDNNAIFQNNRQGLIFIDMYERQAEGPFLTYLLGAFYSGDYRSVTMGGLSYKSFIFNFGFGLFLYFFIYLSLCIPRKNLAFFLFNFVIIASCFFQRPIIFRIEFISLIFVGFIIQNERFHIKKNIKNE
jgi:hypothetical protein